MDLKFSFRLKSSKSNKPSSIRFIIFHKNFGTEGRFVYGTGEKILPKYFDPIAIRPTKDSALLKGLSKEELRTLKRVDTNLNTIHAAAEKVIDHFVFNNLPLNSVDFKLKLDKELRRNAEDIKSNDSIDLNTYIENYIEQLKKSERLTSDGKVLTYGSIKNYLTFKSQFDLFQKRIKRNLNFNDITQDFYNDFVKFLTSKNYSPNTIGKHVARLKKIMRSSEEDGLHQSRDYLKSCFKVVQINTEHIYLQEKEVKAIFDYDFSKSPSLDLYRDVFLIGCYTAQRVSDYKNIKPENITKTSGGYRVLKLIQKKTGEEVMVPIKKELEIILKKYDYHPPVVLEQKLNDAIKEIGKKVGVDELVEIEETRGGKKMRKTVPKYELIKTHTARRTGITNMYLAQIPTLDIMKISGHKKESSFMKYIRLTKEETANKLSQHPYFN